MGKSMDWLKVFAIIIFMMLMGGYYDRLSVETRTMILPLAIFIAATYFIVCLKKMQYELRSSKISGYKLVANEFSLVDRNGSERMTIASDDGVITFYDENHEPRAIMDMPGDNSVLKLKADKGSFELAFNQEETARLTLRNERGDIIWTAP